MSKLTNSPCLLLISAKSAEALEQLRLNYIEYLENTSDAIEDICYTSQIGRAHFAYRLAIIGKSISEILLQLKSSQTSITTINSKWPENLEYARKWFKQNEQNLWEILKGDLDISIIAELYLQGLNFEWSHFNLDNKNNFHKVHLPTYVFQQQRFWIAENHQNFENDEIKENWYYKNTWMTSRVVHQDKHSHYPCIIISDKETDNLLRLKQELQAQGMNCQLQSPEDVLIYLSRNSTPITIIDAYSYKFLAIDSLVSPGEMIATVLLENILIYYQKLLSFSQIKRLLIIRRMRSPFLVSLIILITGNVHYGGWEGG